MVIDQFVTSSKIRPLKILYWLFDVYIYLRAGRGGIPGRINITNEKSKRIIKKSST